MAINRLHETNVYTENVSSLLKANSPVMYSMLNIFRVLRARADFFSLIFFQEEKEQLIEYRSTVASLVGRAKSVVQLRPRSADSNLGTTTPIRAICDYRQIEVYDTPDILPSQPSCFVFPFHITTVHQSLFKTDLRSPWSKIYIT